MESLEFLKGTTKGVARGMDGEKLSKVKARAVSRGQNELVGKFKMAAFDMVGIRGTVYGVHSLSND